MIFFFGLLVSMEVFATEGWQPLADQNSASASSSVCCLGNLTDDFEDGNLAPLFLSGNECVVCGSAAETGGRILLTRPSGCNAFEGTGVCMNSKFEICGDFDISLDFDLISWPNPVGGKYGSIIVYNNDWSEQFVIERFREGTAGGCVPFTEAYKSWHNNGDNCAAVSVQSSDKIGKFRITRT